MNKQGKERWAQAKELVRQRMEDKRVVIVMPRLSCKHKGDILFIGPDHEVERFQFSDPLPGFTGWVASTDENKWGYFHNFRDPWDVFVGKLFTYFGVSSDRKREVYVMSEQEWLEQWDKIVNAI